MDYAKNGCAKALEQFAIVDNMPDDEVLDQLRLFWDRVYASVSADLRENYIEKDIYHILLAQQRTLPPLHQWKRVEELPPPPVPKAPKLPKIQKILLVLAMVVTVVGILMAVLERQKELFLIGLAALGFIALAFVPFLFKPRKMIAPPPKKPSYHWDIRAIHKYLSTAAAGIDADVKALIPRSNDMPDALSLVEELLGQIYQGMLPNSDSVRSKVELYLLRHNIQIVDYTPETAGMFTILPANGEKTLLPALVRDGKVLTRGKACVKLQ